MKRRISALSQRRPTSHLRYRWPGNVRELENAMERAVALASGSRVDLEDLPEEVRMAPSVVALTTAAAPLAVAAGGPRAVPDPVVLSLEEAEREHILAALDRNQGNQTITARELKIGSATLYRRLESYGLTGANFARPVGKRLA